MIAAIHQPQYLPWIGYFHKIHKADVFIFLDNVQYKKNEWQNRNRIKTDSGWQWLTVPVMFRFPERIFEVRVNNRVNWKRKHMQALVTHYTKSKYFEKYTSFFKEVYDLNWEYLSPLNIFLIERISEFLGINTRFITASEMGRFSDDPDLRLIEICKSVGSSDYLAGEGGREYMDLEKWEKAGIHVFFQEFRHPSYPQCYEDFTPNLSIIDLLFNCGSESLNIIESS
ncbi:MAG: WbqC family protein [Fidelibacterota bacterium]